MFRPVFKKRKSGVVKIKRADYGKPSDWFATCKEVKQRDGYKCIFCRKPENPKAGVYHDVHHLKSLARGGTNAKSNLGTTCDDCHKKRPGHSHMR